MCEGRALFDASQGLASSVPTSVLLYLMKAMVSRKEERGGKLTFPPPTQIFLASVVLPLPRQGEEGLAGGL